MKPALFVLLCICVGVSVAHAQPGPGPIIVGTSPPPPVKAPEIDLAAAGSALIVLAGVVAIVRGRRRS